MNCGELIRNERLRQGLSLRQLWRLSGIRDTTICSWENGRTPPVDKLDKVLAALGVSLVIGEEKPARVQGVQGRQEIR